MAQFTPRPDKKGTRTAIDLPTTSPFDPPLQILSREEWGAGPPAWETALPWLPSYVRFVDTESLSPCTTRDGCVNHLKELQKNDIAEGFADINYNFMVGEEGTIYEGRGWKLDVELPNEYRLVQGKCITIAYIGFYRSKPPEWEKIISAYNLLLHGINYKLISPFMDFQHLLFSKP